MSTTITVVEPTTQVKAKPYHGLAVGDIVQTIKKGELGTIASSSFGPDIEIPKETVFTVQLANGQKDMQRRELKRVKPEQLQASIEEAKAFIKRAEHLLAMVSGQAGLFDKSQQ